ncbi:protein OSCP1 [Cylas formicarius]|uniref:protein OSCP1 n=1 Tax=Cylas formicarius TaxID=197179 RepID=UPI0029588FE7|nr:protein OSCP1 [Cylas formicarius]
MSSYVAPFLVLNLGSEMIYVIAQRLQAQNVAEERSTLVLEDLVSGLTSKSLIAALTRPQATYSHESVREIIENITQSSAMRLDAISMSKLWDLITMVFKWQIDMSSEIVEITLRHLYEIETFVASEETQLQLHRVQNIISNFGKVLSDDEKSLLYEDIQYWCKDFHIRVSLLLRMGLQNMDGDFVVNNLDPLAKKMLENLGENIYQATQNGKILENRNPTTTTVSDLNKNVNELNCFVDEVLGGQRKLSSGSMEGNSNVSRLLNDEKLNNNPSTKLRRFDSINVDINEHEKLQDLVHDLNIRGDQLEDTSLKDELLDMIANDDTQSIV